MPLLMEWYESVNNTVPTGEEDISINPNEENPMQNRRIKKRNKRIRKTKLCYKPGGGKAKINIIKKQSPTGLILLQPPPNPQKKEIRKKTAKTQ